MKKSVKMKKLMEDLHGRFKKPSVDKKLVPEKKGIVKRVYKRIRKKPE